MGRAYEVRKVSMAKTAQAKTKIYTAYSKEIFMAAKNGVPDPENNLNLKRTIERAKKKAVPTDVINRAIEKAKSNSTDSYNEVKYEAFGPGSSTLIIRCLTDNSNRSLSDVRTVFNKMKYKLAGVGSVSYAYKDMCIFTLKNTNEEEVMDLLIENDIDVIDIELEDDLVNIYGEVKDYNNIRTAVENHPHIEVVNDEITMLANDYVTLSSEDAESFEKLLAMLNDISDVDDIYHNVTL